MKTPLLGSHIGLVSAASSVPASGATYDPTVSGLTATDLQAVIDELVVLIAASDIEVDDEGTPLTTALASVDFVGDGVTATVVGDAVTVTIPGGGDIQRTFAFFGG